jgi:hypothetical protein
MRIDYFYHTSAKKWRMVDAICFYDSRTSFGSFINLLQGINTDLITVDETQNAMKKSCIAQGEDVQVILFFCYC